MPKEWILNQANPEVIEEIKKEIKRLQS